MSDTKKRSPRAPTINVHHLIKFFAEQDGDIFKVTAAISSHYNYNFTRQQVRNAYVRLNKELTKRGVAELKFAPSRKDDDYLNAAIEEHLASGLLRPVDGAAGVIVAKKPAVVRKPKNQKA